MNLKHKFKLGALSTPLLLPLSAFAGPGTITYAPASQAIPTLSTSMLILLSLLLMVVAFRMKKSNASSKFFIALIGSSLLLASGSGVKLISELEASGGITLSVAGGSTNMNLTSGILHDVRNTSGRTQEILAITVPSSCTDNYPGGVGLPGPECAVGTTLQSTPNNEVCYIDCRIGTISAKPE